MLRVSDSFWRFRRTSARSFICIVLLSRWGELFAASVRAVAASFKSKTKHRKGAVALRPSDYAERTGYVKGLVQEIIHDPGRGPAREGPVP